MSLPLIHYHRDHSVSPCLFTTPHRDGEKPGLLDVLVAVYMCSGFRIVNPYSHGKKLQCVKHSAYAQFFPFLVFQTPFTSKVSAFSPHLLQ